MKVGSEPSGTADNAHAVAGNAWHALGPAEAMAALATGEAGLDAEEAARRLERHGPNLLPEPPRTHPVLRFLAQFNNTLIHFLLAASVAAAVLGHFIDAGVIVAVVVVNAVVGFVQEGRAEQALGAIRDMIAPHATVLRDGRRQQIDARDLVPGDLVVLEAGDLVPADIRLIRARNLLVNEALLTGESLAAEKRGDAVAETAALGDRVSMAHSGTLVAAGQATGIAVATGAGTEIGRISTMIGRVEGLKTPLLVQIDRFGFAFTWFAIAAAALLFAFAFFLRDYPWVDALMVVVALAVSMVPEGLPAVITITLAIGVQRMAARNAVVRRLPAVETLGATSVICSDKTGTLTRNEMTARRVVTADGAVEIAGAGYAPEGGITAPDGSPAPEDGVRDRLLRCALLCNDARLVEHEADWRVLGDPMEGALVTLARKAGLDPDAERDAWMRLDEIPFDAEHRFMATCNRAPDGELWCLVKGAPESLLRMCETEAGGNGGRPVDRDAWGARIASAAANGERVLGFAARPVTDGAARLDMDTLGEGLSFLGIVGFIDPPREEAVAAVADCRAAGIAVKMITGDHADTAAAIARQLALADEPEVVAGTAIDGLSAAELQDLAERTSVFARTSPEHKLRIVEALQTRGHVVAMTGDGVNDAPSLKQADVGVAMGRKGTEAAKEAAEIVLVDDNFASIVAAVREGRTVYDNIRKVISWTLPTNGGEALCVVLAILLGLTLPMTAVQILWVNMILAVTLGLVLAFEPPEPGVMQRRPRRRAAPLLSRFLVWRVGFVSVLFTIGVFGVFYYALGRGAGEDTARTMVVNTLVVMEIFYLFNVRYLHMSSISLRGALGTPAVLIAIAVVVLAQLAFTYAPFMQALFGSAPVSLADGAIIVGIGIAVMIVLEVEKVVMRRAGVLSTVDA